MARDLDKKVLGKLESYKEKYGLKKDEFVKSGSVIMDVVASNGKGLPLNKFIEIASASGLGKTTIVLHAMKAACDEGHRVLYIDTEGGLNDSLLDGIGLTPYLENDMFIVLPLQTYGEAEEVCQDMIGNCSFIVIDSITALLPDEMLEKSITDVLPGIQARYMSNFLQKFKGMITNSGTSMIFINQIRNKFNFRGMTTQDSAGGYAMKFYQDIRFFMKKSAKMEKKAQTADGEKVIEYGCINKLFTKKNRYNAPFVEAEIAVVYGRGVSNLMSYLQWFENNGFVKRSGSWYTLLLDDQELARVCGYNNLLPAIRENFEVLSAYVEEHGGFKLVEMEDRSDN